MSIRDHGFDQWRGRLTLTFICSEERWRSESVQVGGIRSARGALGHWFDKYAIPFLPLFPITLLIIPL
jgi:hypothetical protein